jgi:hypothetical protein
MRRIEAPCLTQIAFGAIAQLGERLPCTQEVSGSIPLGSTKLPDASLKGSSHSELCVVTFRLASDRLASPLEPTVLPDRIRSHKPASPNTMSGL